MQQSASNPQSDKIFNRNLVLTFLFLFLSPVVIGLSLFTVFSLEKSKHMNSELYSYEGVIDHPRSGVRVYASLPNSNPSVLGEVDYVDARPELIRQYLKEYNSPLAPYADTLIKAADTYGLDYRLTTAIAQQESNLCKRIPPGTYNCWGWGIHSRGTLGFNSYEEGIWTVSEGIKKEYVSKGYETIDAIMGKYTPLSNGSWAQGVSTFMADIIN